jgi:hypothetical protein
LKKIFNFLKFFKGLVDMKVLVDIALDGNKGGAPPKGAEVGGRVVGTVMRTCCLILVNHDPTHVTHKLGIETTNVNHESGRINIGLSYELDATSQKIAVPVLGLVTRSRARKLHQEVHT